MALVAIAGQLQLLPVAMACAAEHIGPAVSHCGDPLPVGGPAVSSGDCHGSPACQLGLGCSAAATAIPSLAYALAVTGDQSAVPASATPAPASFDTSPTPPPPQS